MVENKGNVQTTACLSSGAGLTVNIVRFARFLRSQGIPVSLAEVIDAMKCVKLVDISQMQSFYDLLRSNFIFRKEHLKRFDELFRQYWLANDETESAMFSKQGGEAEAEQDQPITLLLEQPYADAPKSPDKGNREHQAFPLTYKGC